MPMNRLSVRLIMLGLVVLGLAGGSRPAAAQGVPLASRGPRFLYASTHRMKPEPIEPVSVPMLRQQISLDLDGTPLAEALAVITKKTGLTFVYSKEVLPGDKRVHLRAEQITVAAALMDILLDSGIDVLLSAGQAALVRRVEPLPAAPGNIAGAVTDTKTKAELAGATVVVQGTSRSATTGSDGRYRIADVAPGAYTVRARYIGYAPGSASVTVNSDQETTADFTLEKSAQRLDEVVTTGTVVPTEVKALPTPVSVISDSDIALQHPRSVQELFRQAIPTAVSFDLPAYPYLTAFSVRGASTLSPGSSQMKVFVDGVETAVGGASAVDPSSIGRIEVIRGPQAAAIYGSDAIGGVLQIFTKRGDQSLTRPQIDAEVSLGAVQTPYAGYGGVLRQSYTGSMRGGGSATSYNFGGGYSRTSDFAAPGSAQSAPSVYGGMHFARGIMTIDVSGRYYTQNNPSVVNPLLAQTGLADFSKPYYQPFQAQHQTMGARVTAEPVSGWQNTLTLGLDRFAEDGAQTQPRLTTPADTLLQVLSYGFTKTSIGYNTAVHSSLGAGVGGALTAGFDHYSLPLAEFFTSGALNTTGTIGLGPGAAITVSRSIMNNTGFYAQGQVSLHDILFVTGGLRAERNSEFGDSLGTPISPRVGLALVGPVGGTTLKVRGSWGRAIRAPSPGDKFAQVSSSSVTLANPLLGPERQHGWDVGVDAAFSGRGSLSVSYYDQTADDLIAGVAVQVAPVLTYQWQNVGRVRNTGVEVEATLNAGFAQFKAQYGYTRARVEQLAPNYAGDLRIGDQVLTTPKHTAGASIVIRPVRGTTIVGGMTYVGSWTNYDYLAEFGCFGQTGPCQATTRDYLVAYPHFVKVNATISQQLTPQLSAFVSMDNLTNNEAYESNNVAAVVGRSTILGARLSY